MEKEMSRVLSLAASVSGDILADMNVYQPLIFMVGVESRRSESERWTQPIYSGSVTSSSSFELALPKRPDQTRPLFFYPRNWDSPVTSPSWAGRLKSNSFLHFKYRPATIFFSTKLNAITWLKFELASYDVANWPDNRFATGIPQHWTLLMTTKK